MFGKMLQSTSVGSKTNECSLRDQVKKYKSKVFVKDGNQETKEDLTLNVQSLRQMCIDELIENVKARPESLRQMPKSVLPFVTRGLEVDLDIECTAPYVADESYWKRCCLAKKDWGNFVLENHGATWKQQYLELNLENVLEEFDPEEGDVMDVLEVAKASRLYIFSIHIEQLLSHLDIEQVFTLLPNLASVHLSYGVKQIGMKYERMLFGMKISDATSLARYVKETQTLTTLKLPGNLLDDDLLRMLMTGFTKNDTITHLDLSHNKLTNHGARLLSKLLGPNSVLHTLDLCDNQIYSEGGRYLSRGLHHNKSLRHLNLRLNRLGDEGGSYLMEGLVQNTTLRSLHLCGNTLGAQSAATMSHVLQQSSNKLELLDFSGNNFTEEDITVLRDGIQNNTNLVTFDLRQNDIPKDSATMVDISNIIRRNEMDRQHQTS